MFRLRKNTAGPSHEDPLARYAEFALQADIRVRVNEDHHHAVDITQEAIDILRTNTIKYIGLNKVLDELHEILRIVQGSNTDPAIVNHLHMHVQRLDKAYQAAKNFPIQLDRSVVNSRQLRQYTTAPSFDMATLERLHDELASSSDGDMRLS